MQVTCADKYFNAEPLGIGGLENRTILGLIGLLFFVRNEIAQLFEIFSLDLLLVVIGIVMVSGIVICLVSTYFVVNKLISLDKGDLYY